MINIQDTVKTPFTALDSVTTIVAGGDNRHVDEGKPHG
jgi:hypothetical protein